MAALRTPQFLSMQLSKKLSHQAERQALRKQLLKQRSQLSETQQKHAELSIIQPTLKLIEHYQAHHIALYLPFNHEISPLALAEKLLSQDKQLYLPIIHPFANGNLLFSRYDQHTEFTPHRWGMLEPKLDVRNVVPLSQIELIFTPLVGCDKELGRLGYGGGFYDRTFEQAPNAIRVGLAHHCQQIEKLPLESWDKPLHHLIIGE